MILSCLEQGRIVKALQFNIWIPKQSKWHPFTVSSSRGVSNIMKYANLTKPMHDFKSWFFWGVRKGKVWGQKIGKQQFSSVFPRAIARAVGKTEEEAEGYTNHSVLRGAADYYSQCPGVLFRFWFEIWGI